MVLKLMPNGEISSQAFCRAELAGMISEECCIAETVYPVRLYNELGFGRDVVMLVDEDGYLRSYDVNRIASWLYQADIHGSCILGPVLFAGMQWSGDGYDLCGLDEATLNKLREKLLVMAEG